MKPERKRDDSMELLSAEIRAQLPENSRQNAARIADDGNTVDFPPAVKLFTPEASCTWLLSEIDPHNPDIALSMANC
jgi:hypothetical protein